MKNIKSLFLIPIILCSFGCSKEKEENRERTKISTLVRLESRGPISEYKIISRDTEKVLANVVKPKYKSAETNSDLTISYQYEEQINMSTNERLTIKVPVTKDLVRFSITVGGESFGNPKISFQPHVYNIDFVSPPDEYYNELNKTKD